MKLYTLFFRQTEKEYQSDRKYTTKKNPRGADHKIFLSVDGGLTVIETDIKKYWDYGSGVEKLIYSGEVDDTLLSPVISEPDFVEDRIKSKKTNETLGYQV